MKRLGEMYGSRINGDLYNATINSDMMKLHYDFKSQIGYKPILPFVTNGSSQGGGGSTSTPENIYDGSSVTTGQVVITSNDTSNWTLFVFDYIPNRSAYGNFTVTGDYFIGVLVGSVLPNGENFLSNAAFDGTTKWGLHSDGNIYQNNITTRLSYLTLAGSLFTVTNSTLGYFKVGRNTSRHRTIGVSGTQNKIIYAVRNGTLTYIKQPILQAFDTLSVGSVVDVDGTDFTAAWGYGYNNSLPYGLNHEFGLNLTLNTNNVQFHYGISHNTDTTYQGAVIITNTVAPSTSQYIVIGSSSGSINSGANSGIGNIDTTISSNIFHFFNNTFTNNSGTVYRVFAVGRGSNNFASIYKSSVTGTGINPFIHVQGTMLSFIIANVNTSGYNIGQIGLNQFDETVTGFAYNSRRFTLYKTLGTTTVHRFPRITVPAVAHVYHFEVVVNDSSTSSYWIGVINTATTNSSVQTDSTLPSPAIFMNIQSGIVSTQGNPTLATFPNTNPNTSVYHVYISVQTAGANAGLLLGRNPSENAVRLEPSMTIYGIVLWSNGGTSDTSQPMVTLHRLTNNAVTYT